MYTIIKECLWHILLENRDPPLASSHIQSIHEINIVFQKTYHGQIWKHARFRGQKWPWNSGLCCLLLLCFLHAFLWVSLFFTSWVPLSCVFHAWWLLVDVDCFLFFFFISVLCCFVFVSCYMFDVLVLAFAARFLTVLIECTKVYIACLFCVLLFIVLSCFVLFVCFVLCFVFVRLLLLYLFRFVFCFLFST